MPPHSAAVVINTDRIDIFRGIIIVGNAVVIDESWGSVAVQYRSWMFVNSF